MRHIILTEEQMRILAEASDTVEVRDAQGRTVAQLQRFDPEKVAAIEEAKRRLKSPGPRIPAAEVEAHFRKLEEIRQREGMDETKMWALLKRMRAGEEV